MFLITFLSVSKEIANEEFTGNDYSLGPSKQKGDILQEELDDHPHEFVELIKHTLEKNQKNPAGNDYMGDDYNEDEGSADSVDPLTFIRGDPEHPRLDVCTRRNSSTPDCKTEFHQKYRTYSGVCNNLKERFWGATLEPYLRIKPPAYDDGIGRFKIKDRTTFKTQSGETRTVLIPNARKLSRFLHYKHIRSSELSTTSTHLLMQMGQFVDHDVTLAPELGKKEEL